MYIEISITENGNWYNYITKFLVPKTLGLIKTTINGILRYRKLLPVGHRLRQPREKI